MKFAAFLNLHGKNIDVFTGSFSFPPDQKSSRFGNFHSRPPLSRRGQKDRLLLTPHSDPKFNLPLVLC